MYDSLWLPILVQFGLGAALGGVGLYAGLSSGYLSWEKAEDRGTVYLLVGGYLAFLLVYCLFTFYLPFVPEPIKP